MEQNLHRVSFVIAPLDLGYLGVEPVIDGVSLVERISQLRGEIDYAGLARARPWLDVWGAVLAARGGRVKVLGCLCGDYGCAYVSARWSVSDREVVWSDFEGSHRPYPDSPDESALEPFRFDRQSLEQALASPHWSVQVALDRPVHLPDGLRLRG